MTEVMWTLHLPIIASLYVVAAVLTPGEFVFPSEIRIEDRYFRSEFADPTSNLYRELKQEMEAKISRLYGHELGDQQVRRIDDVTFSDGSLVMRYKLVLSSNISVSKLANVLAMASTNKTLGFHIKSSTVNATGAWLIRLGLEFPTTSTSTASPVVSKSRTTVSVTTNETTTTSAAAAVTTTTVTTATTTAVTTETTTTLSAPTTTSQYTPTTPQHTPTTPQHTPTTRQHTTTTPQHTTTTLQHTPTISQHTQTTPQHTTTTPQHTTTTLQHTPTTPQHTTTTPQHTTTTLEHTPTTPQHTQTIPQHTTTTPQHTTTTLQHTPTTPQHPTITPQHTTTTPQHTTITPQHTTTTPQHAMTTLQITATTKQKERYRKESRSDSGEASESNSTSASPKCVNTTCQHGGTCVAYTDTFTCLCVRGYNGTHCELDTRHTHGRNLTGSGIKWPKCSSKVVVMGGVGLLATVMFSVGVIFLYRGPVLGQMYGRWLRIQTAKVRPTNELVHNVPHVAKAPAILLGIETVGMTSKVTS